MAPTNQDKDKPGMGSKTGTQTGSSQASKSGSSQSSGTSNRGFASMDPDKQREIASEGGKAAHEAGTAHEFTSEEARRAGSMSHGNRQSENASTSTSTTKRNEQSTGSGSKSGGSTGSSGTGGTNKSS